MNGKRYLLDTNAAIQLLAGNPSLIKMVEDSDFLAISVISKLEFLSYPDLTEDEKNAFSELLEDLTVFDLMASDSALMQEAVAMRIDGGLKLPDAVIAATALVNDCEVITNDAHFAHQKRVRARTYDL
ncbi:MAG: type II toxin-antitoxin system VapC family toxin [Kiritimatiellae bacterium]|nr:type II toxin-antitoxin system VapC family toxin [Kiritimatiellia bacterium]